MRQDRRPLHTRLGLESLEARAVPAVFSPSATAADSLGDHNSLRYAIAQADRNADASNTIVLGPGTYSLSAGELVIRDSSSATPAKTLTIEGTGAGSTAVDGGEAARVFRVVGSSGQAVTVLFESLTIQDGLATAPPASTTGNVAGGGLLIQNAAVSLTGVTVSNNEALGAAGADGLGNGNGANGGAALGGGIYLDGGSLTLTDSTVSGNQALGGGGGKGGDGFPVLPAMSGEDGERGEDGETGKPGS